MQQWPMLANPPQSVVSEDIPAVIKRFCEIMRESDKLAAEHDGKDMTDGND